jgi:beta-barrel assembly-enhancing protease
MQRTYLLYNPLILISHFQLNAYYYSVICIFYKKTTLTYSKISFYEATYFDGKSSYANLALLRIIDKQIEMSYHHQGMETCIIRWNEQQIREIETDYSGKSTIRFGEFPFQMVEVYSKTFSEEILQHFPSLNKGTPYAWLRRTGTKGIVIATVSIVLAMGLIYTYVLPWLGETLVCMVVSKEYEKELGEKSYETLMLPFSKDERKTKLLQEYITELNLETSYKIEGTVLQSETVNAFALMGGKVVVFDEILSVMSSSNELSALLAHEVTHVEERHVLKGIGKNMVNLLVIAWLTSDASAVSAVLLDNANAMVQRSYSRTLEEEADKKGFERLVHCGINPQGMLALMQHLKEQEKDGLVDSKWSRFLSDHPLTDDRIQYITDLLNQKKLEVNLTRQKNLDRIFNELRAEERKIGSETNPNLEGNND